MGDKEYVCGTCAYWEKSCRACFNTRSSHCSTHTDSANSCTSWREELASESAEDQKEKMLYRKMRNATRYQRQKLMDENARITQSLIQAGEITDPDVIAKNKEDIAIIEARQEKNRIAGARYRERHREELRCYYKLYRNMTKGAVY